MRYVYHDPWVQDEGSAYGAIGAGLYDAQKPCMGGQVYQRRQYVGAAEEYATPCPVCVPVPSSIGYDVRVMRVDDDPRIDT